MSGWLPLQKVEVTLSLSLVSRINSWLFLNYEADKIGSFIFESRAGRPVARNKTNTNITRGSLLFYLQLLTCSPPSGNFSSTAFSVVGDSLIFLERGGQKVETVEKYSLKVEGGSLSLQRDWMKTWPCKTNYTNNGQLLLT